MKNFVYWIVGTITETRKLPLCDFEMNKDLDAQIKKEIVKKFWHPYALYCKLMENAVCDVG
jgi:hypothetical protein